jgi:peroxiredoxin
MVLMPRLLSSLVLAIAALGCGARSGVPTAAPAPTITLQDTSASVALADLVKQKPLTVLFFFTGECPVMKAHDARFRELVATYRPKGVTFVAVLSETGADVAAEREEARRRALDVPVLEDRGAALADALGVEYSTHSVLLDSERRVLYSGAIDSDRTHLTEGAERYLRDALDASLGGRAIAKSHVDALGCPLRKH